MTTIAIKLGCDPRTLHWPKGCFPKPAPKPVIETNMQKWRAKNIAKGLTANGNLRRRALKLQSTQD